MTDQEAEVKCTFCDHPKRKHGDDPSYWGCWAAHCRCKAFQRTTDNPKYSMTCDGCGFVLEEGHAHLCRLHDGRVVIVTLNIEPLKGREALINRVESKLGESLVFQTMTDEQLEELANLPWVGQQPTKQTRLPISGSTTNCAICGHSVDSHPASAGCKALIRGVSGQEQCCCGVKFA